MKKRIFTVLFIISLLTALLCISVSAATYNGICGDNVTWSLDTSTGVLTISGTGNIEDYNINIENREAPWYSYKNDVKSVIIKNGVANISRFAFFGCDSLTAVTIQQSVTSIGDAAFYNCAALNSIIIPSNVTSIGDSAFYNCTSLANITIPKNVTYIGSAAFYNCSSLTSIAIPDGVTSILGSTFGNCTSLTGLTVPESVTNIVYNAFENTGYYNDSSNWSSGVLYIGNHLMEAKNDISHGYTVDAGTKTIADYAFRGCLYVSSINLPDSLTSIGTKAFYHCDSLKSVVIPDGVTTIGSSAFEYCSNLKSVTIPDSVTSIGDNAFIQTDYYSNASNWQKDSSCWENSVLYIGNHLIEAKDATSYNYTVKESTKTIADNAFDNCSRLKSVTIPDSVTNIGRRAFDACTALTSVNIPSAVTSIEDGTFSGCASLATVSLPGGVTKIGSWAFHGCSSLTNFTIPDGVTSIGDSAFYDCTSLTGITIPDGVTSIWDSTFVNCDALSSVTIPDSVTSIGRYAFSDCDSLTDVYYNDSESQWSKIAIGDGNDPLINAAKHFLPESISIKTLPAKVEYFVGETPDYTGLTLTATYGSTNVATVTEGFTISPVDTSTAGMKTVTVTYESRTATFKITIKQISLVSVSVKTLPAKLTYLEGKDKLDLTGGVLTLGYNNGSKENIPLSYASVTGFDNTKVGKQTLTATYQGKTATFNVTVVAKSLESITVTTLPLKTEYLEGKDELDITGGLLTLNYNNDTIGFVPLSSSSVTGFDNTKPGAQTLTVAYQGKTTTFDITITPKSVTRITVKALPSKTVYLEAKDEFDATDGIITAYYNNDTQEELEMAADMITGFDNTKVGAQTVSVNYGGKKAAFSVRVIPNTLSSIAVTTFPAKLAYRGDDALDLTGGALTAYYDNDFSEEISITVDMVTGFDPAVTGAQTLTVTYGGKTATFEISMIAVTKITIKTMPAKLTYKEGDEALDLTGGVLTVFYGDETQTDIPLSEVGASGYDNMTPGIQKLTVTYGGKTASFNVVVTAKVLDHIEIAKRPATLLYRQGVKSPDVSGGEVALCYDNGMREVIRMTPDMVTGFDTSSVGASCVTVTYNGKETYYPIRIVTEFAWEYELNKYYIELSNAPAAGHVYAAFYGENGIFLSASNLAFDKITEVPAGALTAKLFVLGADGAPKTAALVISVPQKEPVPRLAFITSKMYYSEYDAKDAETKFYICGIDIKTGVAETYVIANTNLADKIYQVYDAERMQDLRGTFFVLTPRDEGFIFTPFTEYDGFATDSVNALLDGGVYFASSGIYSFEDEEIKDAAVYIRNGNAGVTPSSLVEITAARNGAQNVLLHKRDGVIDVIVYSSNSSRDVAGGYWY